MNMDAENRSKIDQKSMPKRGSEKRSQKDRKASENGAQNDPKNGYFMLKNGKRAPGERKVSI